MTIKQTGGIFGRNPTFNDVDIDGDLTVAGDLTVQGTTITVDSATAQSIVLGDNDKMTFGDGPDLEIYSDGTTGQIAGNVNVTGTVTADGLTSSGNLTFDAVAINTISSNGFLYYNVPTGYTHTFQYNGTNVLNMNGPDIYFYEDTGTTPKMVWSASAEALGIGTTSVSTSGSPLVTRGTTTGKGFVSDNGSNAGFVVQYASGLTSIGQDFNAPLAFLTNNTERMRIDSGGNVGISINKVFGSGNGYAGNTAAASSGTLELWDTSGHVNLANNWGSGAIKFTVGASERMRIDASGNVGIGVTPSAWGPSFRAVDLGAFGVSLHTNTGGAGGINFNSYNNNTNWIYKNNTTAFWYNQNASGHAWYTAPSGTAGNAISFTQAMTLTAGGNLGIGSTGPVSKLEVVNSGVASLFVGYNNTSENYYDANTHYFRSGNGSTERMRIDSSGNLMVGLTDITDATSRTYGNAFSGSSAYANWTSWGSGTHAHAVFRNATNQVGSIATNSTTTTYNITSDYRLKENVVELTGATDRIKQIPVHRFNFIADADTTVDGFLAHEVQAIVPEAVVGTKDAVDADGNPVYQGIDQSKLVPLLTAALQEALTEIAALKDRVAALEA